MNIRTHENAILSVPGRNFATAGQLPSGSIEEAASFPQRTEAHSIIRAVADAISFPSGATAKQLQFHIPEFSVISGGKINEYPVSDSDDSRATSSERMLGERKLEVDRLIVSLRSLDQLCRGGEQAYFEFRSCQPDETAITFRTFEKLSRAVQSKVDSDEKRALLSLALINNTAAKAAPESWGVLLARLPSDTQALACQSISRLTSEQLGQTDDHVDRLARILHSDQILLPTLGHVAPAMRDSYAASIAKGPNLGQLLRLESPMATLESYSELDRTAHDLHLAQFLCQICGARGHDAENGSLVMVEKSANRFLLMEDALKHGTPRAIYHTILNDFAESFGFNPGTQTGIALTRLAAMMDLTSLSAAKQLAEVFHSDQLSHRDRSLIIRELNVTGLEGREAVLVYHAPALFSAILSSPFTESNGVRAGISIALNKMARVLDDSVTHLDLEARNGVRKVSVREVAKVAPSDYSEQHRHSFHRQGKHGYFVPLPTTTSATEWSAELESESLVEAVTGSRHSHQAIGELHDRILSTLGEFSCRLAAAHGDPQFLRTIENHLELLFHVGTQIALHCPRRFNDTTEPPEVNEADSLSRSLGALDRSIYRLIDSIEPASRSEKLKELVGKFSGLHRGVHALRERIEKLPRLYDFELSRQNDRWRLSFHGASGRSGTITYSHNAPASGSIELGDLLREYGPVTQIYGRNLRDLTADEQVILINGFRTVSSRSDIAISDSDAFCLMRGSEPREFRTGSAHLYEFRYRRINSQLHSLSVELGRATDSLSVTQRHHCLEADGSMIRLMTARRELLQSAQRLLMSPTNENHRRFNTQFNELSRLALHYRIADLKFGTRLEKTDESQSRIEVSERLAALSAESVRRPSDPAQYDQGGTLFDRSSSGFRRIFELGARAITCQDESDRTIGYCLYVPARHISKIAPLIPNQYLLYGAQALIHYLYVAPGVPTGAPAYDLLCNRFRIENSEADVVIGRILLENRRSLAINISSSGKGALNVDEVVKTSSSLAFSGYNSLAELRKLSQAGQDRRSVPSFDEIPELSVGESTGMIAPLSQRWWKSFDNLSFGDSGAVEIARLISNRNLPGLFDCDIRDLLTLWYKVGERKIYLEERNEQISRRDAREASVTIPEWQRKVSAFLHNAAPPHVEISEDLNSGDWRRIMRLAPLLEPYAGRNVVRTFLDYF